ncbi:peptidase family M1-domain-containing protein [Neocallimastix sp. 'constans']
MKYFKKNILLNIVLLVSPIIKIEGRKFLSNLNNSEFYNSINNLNLKTEENILSTENDNIILEEKSNKKEDSDSNVDYEYIILTDITEDVFEQSENGLFLDDDINLYENKTNIEFSSIKIDDIETDGVETDDIETDDIETDDIETSSIEIDDIETNDNETDDIYSSIRLPETVLPIAYRLDFYTSLENFTFKGKAEIDIEILEETDIVIFHSNQLSLSNINISNDIEKWIPNSINYSKKNQYVILRFNNNLKSKTNYTLNIQYSGELNSEDMTGYFVDEYKNNDGSLSNLAATQFQATYARKAFPCFDEPQLKATFQVNMTVDDGLMALSNMNVINIEELENLKQKKYIFENSVKMSTYLVAFVVSDFKCVSDKYNSIDINVYSRPDQIENTKYALDITIKILKFYENLYRIPYSLPKLDLIAIPKFSFGAMENWGLITFIETSLLYNEKIMSPYDKQHIVVSIAHELAHQWFGNLVTMKWWDDLWLNEGFANYIQYIGLEVAEPNFGSDNQWYIEDVLSVMAEDTSYITHPVYYFVDNPEEIENLFDHITYYKGSAIIRMMESWLNNINFSNDINYLEDSYFYKRINEYLNLYKYNNADNEQLWKSLESYNREGMPINNVAKTMESFINQSGYPIVMMIENQKDYILNLNQEQYSANRLELLENNESMEDTKWVIPYSYNVYSNNTGKPELIESKYIILEDEINISLPSDKEDAYSKIFVKGNVGQKGYYSVQYDDESLRIACEWLKSDLEFMSFIDRAGFLHDMLDQLFNGRIGNPEIILNCLDFLKKEKSINVWSIAISYLYTLIEKLNSANSNEHVNNFVISIIENILKDIDWVEKESQIIEKFTIKDNTIHNRSIIRGTLLNLACSVREENTINQALYYFNKIKNGTLTENFDDEIMFIIYSNGIRYGDEENFNFILEEFKNETSDDRKEMLSEILTYVSNSSLQKKLFKFAISDFNKDLNIENIFESVILIHGSYAQETCFEFIKENWNTYFKENYLLEKLDFSRIIELVTLNIKNEEFLEKINFWLNTINKDLPIDFKISIENDNESDIIDYWTINENLGVFTANWIKENY